ncbi:MAG TPA: YdjY domain-containing protein [Urbifossiella sp.]|nr:YdjY domain-containing protein [Urbifossiella sp.]
MKSALLAAAVGGVVLAAGLAPQSLPASHVVSAQQPAKEAPPETLPEPPKLDPKNNHVALDKDRTFLMEQGPDKKFIRVLVATDLCLREGPLEVFCCKKGTKEHESILRVATDAKLIHTALVAAGGKPGKTPQFLNPKTGEPEFKPATGSKIKVLVHYKKDGKLHTHRAQEWIWNSMKKKAVDVDWVFAGSQLIKDADNPEAEAFYGANSGEVISVSNFPYSMLELPIEINKDDATLNYEVKTDRVPPLFSKVWLILEPVTERK